MAQDKAWWKQGSTEIQPTSTQATAGQPSGDWWKQGASLVNPESPSLARSVGDSAIALGTGVAQGVKMVSDAFGANNAVSRLMGKGIQAAEGLESDHRKAEKQERATMRGVLGQAALEGMAKQSTAFQQQMQRKQQAQQQIKGL